MRKPPTASEALGMKVPPAGVVAGASRVRGAMQRAATGMAPPFMRVIESLMGMVDTKALYCAVELGVPDVLGSSSKTASQIASEIKADPDAVHRLLRYLVSRGFFARKGAGGFTNNHVTETLRSDHPFTSKAWVLFFGSDWNAQIWNHLPQRVRGTTSAPEAAFGTDYFTFLNEKDPAAGKLFNDAMAIGSKIQATMFSEHVKLNGVRTVCDVGGGTGSVLAHLLQANASLTGTVFDLPALASEARRVFDAAGVADRGTFSGGDFFKEVPVGCDLYTMFAIVHDWDDESVRKILRNIRAAMPATGRVMVVEKPVPTDDRADFAKASDLLMLAYTTGGRERTDDEYKTLFRSGGFLIKRRRTLPSLFAVYELVPG